MQAAHFALEIPHTKVQFVFHFHPLHLPLSAREVLHLEVRENVWNH